MKKILINGGSHSDIPLIKAAKKLGYYVITTGNNKNDLGHKFSNLYIKADYSNKDEILHIMKDYNIDYIIPSCNDFSILTASYVMEQLNLKYFDSFEVTKLIHYKDLFRKFTMKNNIPAPMAISFDNFEDLKKYGLSNIFLPCIIKPIDLTGGKGVNIAKNYNEILKYANNAFKISKAKRIVIEEFIEGEHYSCFSFIYNKNIKIIFFAKEYYFKNDFLVAGAFSDYSLDNKIKQIVSDNIKRMINLLDLKNGILHIQFILKNNIPYFIEATRRPPGDLYLKLVDYSLDIDISKLFIKSCCNNLSNNDFDFKIERNNILRHCIMSDKNGVFESIMFNKNYKIKEVYQILKSGDKITDYMKQKLAIVFLEFVKDVNINTINYDIKPIIN